MAGCTRFFDPPRPKFTLAQLRRYDNDAWRLMQILIRKWIEEIQPEPIPGDFVADLFPGMGSVIEGNIAGEAKLEAIEELLDKGFLRMVIRPNKPQGGFSYLMEVWNGRSYQMVGRGRGAI